MKTINKMMTNGEIYQNALNLVNSFNEKDQKEIYFPAAVNFSILKNKTLVHDIAEEIEKSRMDIILHYSTSQNGDTIVINPEDVDKANKELEDLLNIQQEIKVYTFKIEDLSEIQLTSAQMQAILFMIEED